MLDGKGEHFNREEKAGAEDLKHTTLATSRLRFLFLAAKIWRHGGRVGVSYSDHYAEQGIFQRLMELSIPKTRSRQEDNPAWLRVRQSSIARYPQHRSQGGRVLESISGSVIERQRLMGPEGNLRLSLGGMTLQVARRS